MLSFHSCKIDLIKYNTTSPISDVPSLMIFHQLQQHGLQELLLLQHKSLHGHRVKNLARPLPFPQPLSLQTDALLEHLEAVLRVLAVELRKVTDAADAGEDNLVAHERVARAERGDHADAFAAALGFEGLVFDVAALHDDGGSLKDGVSHRLYQTAAFLQDGGEHTMDGPRTFITSPLPIRIAVSPPTMPVQSDSIVTHTKG